MSRFADKVVLITGASSGIGLACAQRFSDEGARVFCAQRGVSGFEDIAANFSDADAPAQGIAAVIERAGWLDVLVNNAGVMEEGTVEDTSLEAWQLTLHINLTAPFLLIKHAMPHLRAAKGQSSILGRLRGWARTPAILPIVRRRLGCMG